MSDFTYDVVETIQDDNVYAEVLWNIPNAVDVSLNGEAVANSGFRKFLVNRTKRCKFKYKAGGVQKKRIIHISIENRSFWLVWNFNKLLLRPFTFVGYVGKKEMRVTSLLSLLSILCVIAIFVQRFWGVLWDEIYNGDIVEHLIRYDTASLTALSVIFFIWIMQLGKRYKDCGHSAWNTIWFSPLVIFPLVVEYIPASLEFEYFAVGYVIYSVVFLIATAIAASQESKNNKRYKRIKVW